MATASGVGGHAEGFGATQRRDNWWVGPVLSATLFTSWVLYYTWAALQGKYYAAGPYLSPFYAPLLFSDPSQPGSAAVSHAFFGPWPAWWPAVVPPSPALLIGAFPAAFRLTCYYYRKMYYRSFFGMPPGCAVGPVRHNYTGETGLLVIQNLHRYTMYIAIALLPFLFYEAFRAFYWEGHGPGVGIGSVLLLVNAILLSGYTLGCHAWRHVIGGRLNCFSCDGGAEAQHQAWTFTSWLNARHMLFAWASLGWIFLCDVYVRLLSMGVIPDVNTWQGVAYMTGGH
jgi:hypothetical protein